MTDESHSSLSDGGVEREIEQAEIEWAIERATSMCASALLDAQVYGKRLLKGFGYPNETFGRAQDHQALRIVLTLLSTRGAALAEMQEIARKLDLDLAASIRRETALEEKCESLESQLTEARAEIERLTKLCLAGSAPGVWPCGCRVRITDSYGASELLRDSDNPPCDHHEAIESELSRLKAEGEALRERVSRLEAALRERSYQFHKAERDRTATFAATHGQTLGRVAKSWEECEWHPCRTDRALLTASAPSSLPCVCEVPDGLVQEWVSKARAVAKSKGFTVAKRPQAPAEEER